MRYRRNGFIELRTLIALLITLSILPLAVTVFKYVSNFTFDYNLVNNEMALMDLRRILLLAYDKEISDHEINFIYQNDNYTLSYVNNKLILQPGTQIFLNDIEMASFECRNGSVYVKYVDAKGEEYERNICREQGLYLADFSNTDEQLLDADDSE